MPSTVRNVVFSEPSGQPHATIMFASAVFFAVIYAYFSFVGDEASVRWQLGLGAGFLLSAIAESLPEDRRRTAGAFRVTALGVLFGFLAVSVIAPEVLFAGS